MAELMNQSKDFNAFVTDPSVPRATKIDGLDAVLTKMGATDITKNFVGARARRWPGGSRPLAALPVLRAPPRGCLEPGRL